MADIKEKIKKLLSLAESPNENEAKAALLKAKQLMMEYKISDVDIEDKGELTHLTCNDIKWTTDSGDIWMNKLCTLLAENYCCVAAWITYKGTRTHTLQITGLGADAEICKKSIEFAIGFIKGTIKVLQRRMKSHNPKSIAHSYAEGFIMGLEFELEEQKEEHPEWGLMVVNPKEVEDYKNSLGDKSVRTKKSNFNPAAYARGQMDGKEFISKKALEVGA